MSAIRGKAMHLCSPSSVLSAISARYCSAPIRCTCLRRRACGRKAEISAAIQAIDPAGNFLIDFNADHPAVPFPRDVPLVPAPTLRALNAIELARVAHDFSKRLQKGEPPPALGLGFECVGTACADILKRMLRFWGLGRRRPYSRPHFPRSVV